MVYYMNIVALFSMISLCQATFLWRINVNPPAYLFGTVHLPHRYIWPSISETAKSAFYNSTHFLPEFDMTNFFLFTRFRMCINSYRPPNTNGPPPPPPLQPVNQFGDNSNILDVYLTIEARRLGKIVTSLESINMYCEFTKFQIDSLTTNITSQGMKMTLPKKEDYEQVKRAYNCDLNFPGEIFPPRPIMIPDKTLVEFHQRLQELVERRDSEMALAVHNLIKDNSLNNRYFFAVGFIHLMSAEGIIEKLKRDYKYSITRLCTDPLESRANLRCPGPSWCDSIGRL